MRTRQARKTALVVAATGALFLGAVQARAVMLDATISGTTLTMKMTPGSGEAVVGTLNDFMFATGGITIGAGADPATTLSAALDAAGGTVSVADAGNLPDFGIIVIDDEHIAYESKDGNNLTVATDGQNPPTVTGRGQDGTTAAAHASGAAVSVPNDLPACEGTAALATANKSAVFSFLPDGCTPGTDCEGIRAIVIALDNLSEITTATDLYTCTVTGAGDAPACPGDTAADPFQPAQSSKTPSDDPSDLLPTTCTVSKGSNCVGDQNGSGNVDAGEATRAILAFGTGDVSRNPAADINGSGNVDAGEATRSILNFGRGTCTP